MADPVTGGSAISANVGSAFRSDPRTSSVDAAQNERQSSAVSGNAEPASREIRQATQDISDYIQTISRSLQISVDGDLGATVIRVLDAETDQVVRQIPSEEILQIARFISEQRLQEDTLSTVRGLLMDSET